MLISALRNPLNLNYQLPFECKKNLQLYNATLTVGRALNEKHLDLNVTYGNWWWQFAWREEWMPDSITKFGCVVNIKSIQEDWIVHNMGWFLIWWKPKLEVKKSIFDPSKLVL